MALADSVSVADQKRSVYSVLPNIKAGPCGLPLCFGTLSVAHQAVKHKGVVDSLLAGAALAREPSQTWAKN